MSFYEARAQFSDSKIKFTRAVIAYLEGKPTAVLEVDDALRDIEQALNEVRTIYQPCMNRRIRND